MVVQSVVKNIRRKGAKAAKTAKTVTKRAVSAQGAVSATEIDLVMVSYMNRRRSLVSANLRIEIEHLEVTTQECLESLGMRGIQIEMASILLAGQTGKIATLVGPVTTDLRMGEIQMTMVGQDMDLCQKTGTDQMAQVITGTPG